MVLLFSLVVFMEIFSLCFGALRLRGNESELLSVWDVQAVGLFGTKKLITKVIEEDQPIIMAVPNIFRQQNGIYPPAGQLQLDNFGATIPWNNIIKLLNNSSRRLLVMIRHAQAWENLNPNPNYVCEFEYEGRVIQNFDSALSTEGVEQARALNSILRSSSALPGKELASQSEKTWFQAMGLENELFVTSPLMRTMETTSLALNALDVNKISVHELIRASIGFFSFE